MKGATVLVVAMLALPGPARGDAELERALAIEREVQRIAGERELWPGFEPLGIPLAIFTGERTFLFRHTAPPEGFRTVDGTAGAWVFEGRHPAMTANSSADIGGVATATLIADAPQAPAALAAVALHEAFHVDQRRRHRGWTANEGDLFLYPVEDAELLALRRLESEALRRALAAAGSRGDAGAMGSRGESGAGSEDAPAVAAACWARRAMELRARRFAAMGPQFAAYERDTELNEGLAAYVQLVAAGDASVEIPAEGFEAGAVRARAYLVGPALALLLDRLRPGWQAELDAGDGQLLDELLREALAGDEGGGAGPGGNEPGGDGLGGADRSGDPRDGCGFTAREHAEAERVARGDVAGLAAQRALRRASFDARPGWRVVVEAPAGQPLWPRGFDPLNVERVDGAVVHERFLNLANDVAELQVLDEEGADVEALTEGAGEHPLFHGVRRVVVAGLAEPAIARPPDGAEDGETTLRAAGLTASFRGARVEVAGHEVRVTWRAAGR